MEVQRKRPHHAKPFHHLQAQKDLRKKRSAMAEVAERYQKKVQALRAQKSSMVGTPRQPTTLAPSTWNRFQGTPIPTSWNWKGLFNTAMAFTTPPRPTSNYVASQSSGGTERKRAILDAIQWDSD